MGLVYKNGVGFWCAKWASDQRVRGEADLVINQMVNGWAVSARRALAHNSTAPGAADHISEQNHRVWP